MSFIKSSLGILIAVFCIGLITGVTNAQQNDQQQNNQNTVTCDFTTHYCRLLTVGTRGEDVTRLKMYLKSKGMFANEITTDSYNGLVKLRVSELQRSFGLIPTGNLNSEIRAILNAEIDGGSAEVVADKKPVSFNESIITTSRSAKISGAYDESIPPESTIYIEYAKYLEKLDTNASSKSQEKVLSSLGTNGNFDILLNNLTSSNDYWFKIIIKDGDKTYSSTVGKFTTNNGGRRGGSGGSSGGTTTYYDPTISSNSTSSVWNTQATINVSYTTGDLDTDIEYTIDTDPTFSSNPITHTEVVTASPSSGTSSYTFTGLTTATQYSYKIVATNSHGSSSTLTGTSTTSTASPSISTPTVTAIGAGSATLNINYTVYGSSTADILYTVDTVPALNSGNQFTITHPVTAGSGSDSATFSSLDPATTYYYSIMIYNWSVGNNSTSGNFITTATPIITTPVFQSKFGIAGSGVGKTKKPQGIDISTSGDLYVTDWNHTVKKYSATGTYVSEFGQYGTHHGELNNPMGISLNTHDEIYVANYANNVIGSHDSLGHFVADIGSQGSGNGEFESPQWIETDSTGNIYVSDTLNNRVQILDATGAFINAFGVNGTGNGEFNLPQGIAMNQSDEIYVVDYGNDRVQKFDSAGNYILQFGTTGSGNGELSGPKGIALDSNQNVYVVDTYNNRVQVFDPSGTYMTQFGVIGTSNGEFNLPSGIAIDKTTNIIYIADTDNDRLQIFQ